MSLEEVEPQYTYRFLRRILELNSNIETTRSPEKNRLECSLDTDFDDESYAEFNIYPAKSDAILEAHITFHYADGEPIPLPEHPEAHEEILEYLEDDSLMKISSRNLEGEYKDYTEVFDIDQRTIENLRSNVRCIETVVRNFYDTLYREQIKKDIGERVDREKLNL